jgi:uncharacterized membrane protein YkvA (DUF1232 family)
MGELVQRSGSQPILSRLPSDLQNLKRLAIGLARDPRVPRRNKMIFAGVLAYLVMPVDLVPDWLPGIGKLDDLIMLCLAIDSMLNHIPEAIIDDYWAGDRTTLNVIRRTVATASDFLPPQVAKTLYPAELR